MGPWHPVLKSRSERSRPLGGGAVKTRTPWGLWKEHCAWSLGEAEILHTGSEKVLVFAPLYRRALVVRVDALFSLWTVQRALVTPPVLIVHCLTSTSKPSEVIMSLHFTVENIEAQIQELAQGHAAW